MPEKVPAEDDPHWEGSESDEGEDFDESEWEEYEEEEWEEEYDGEPLSLEEQAAELRAESSHRSFVADSGSWQKAFYLFCVFASLSCAVYLLIFQETRRDLVRLASQHSSQWLLGDSEPTLHRLQAPPPRRTQRTIQVGNSPQVIESPSEVLYYNSTPEGPAEEIVDPTRPAPPPPAEKNEQSISAFNLLRENSEVAALLISGELDGLTYLDWKPVRNAPPEFYLELLVEGAEGALVWLVDLESETVRALSFHATQLVARHRRGEQ